jgi:hypothetical protein
MVTDAMWSCRSLIIVSNAGAVGMLPVMRNASGPARCLNSRRARRIAASPAALTLCAMLNTC